LIGDLSKAYEVLEVKPGVSNSELKAAHRDLAKVWHPDRFLHDPRLQEKAQEKLKEINEAYELLISGKTPRPTHTPQTVHPAKTSTPRRASNGTWAVVLLVFVAVFAITTRALLQHRTQPVADAQVQTEEPAKVDQETSTRAASNTRAEPTRKGAPEESPAEETATPSAPTAALATVTVLIDPESGLLAKANCPVRSRMTYPRGSEPSGYCNINHTPAPKESRMKTLTQKILPRRKGATDEVKPTN
jgi:DnaJ-like protein